MSSNQNMLHLPDYRQRRSLGRAGLIAAIVTLTSCIVFSSESWIHDNYSAIIYPSMSLAVISAFAMAGKVTARALGASMAVLIVIVLFLLAVV